VLWLRPWPYIAGSQRMIGWLAFASRRVFHDVPFIPVVKSGWR
jgi:hypothetical protein